MAAASVRSRFAARIDAGSAAQAIRVDRKRLARRGQQI